MRKVIMVAALVGVLVSGTAMSEGEILLEQYGNAAAECEALWNSFLKPENRGLPTINKKHFQFSVDPELEIKIWTTNAYIKESDPSIICQFDRLGDKLRWAVSTLKMVRYRIYTQSTFQELTNRLLPIITPDMIIKPN